MRPTKTRNRNGQPKGAWLYGIKNNGERYVKPAFYEFSGSENTPEDVKARMEKLNPGKTWEVAENQDELNDNNA